MRTIYLAGPIHGCTDEEAHGWRNAVTAWAANAAAFRIRNPMRRDYRGRVVCNAVIVEVDKRDIRESDVLLVRWSQNGCGTPMEILYAYEREIPIVVWVNPCAATSPWLSYHASIMVSSFDDAMTAVEELIK